MSVFDNETIQELVKDLQKRVADKILEKNNYDFLIKLLKKADSIEEAINICSLGTTYKKTGLQFEKKLEKETETIKYLEKDHNLSVKGGELVHKLIIGDNFPILKNLLIEYRNKIDIIYIDPPYGMDGTKEFAKTNYENRLTRDNLLSMLLPRLELAKQLLAPSGVIFCSIDDRNYAYLKILFDDVFQEKNFVNTLIWHSNKSIMKGSQFIRKDHEYILVYAKDKESLTFNKLRNNMTFSNPDKDPNGPWYSSNATYKLNPNHPNYYGIKVPNGDVIYRTWRFSEKEYLDGKIPLYFNGSNVPRLKLYEKEVDVYTSVPSTIVPINKSTILDEHGTLTTAKGEIIDIFGKDIFETPKPVRLIEYLLEISATNNSIVLDFFAGSGSTGEAVLSFNKKTNSNCKFILATNNETGLTYPNGIALDVTTKRIKRILSGECYDGTKDFAWLNKNTPFKDSLDVYNLKETNVYDKDIFEEIDETAYGLEKFNDLQEKIEWVCNNFQQVTFDIVDGDDQ